MSTTTIKYQAIYGQDEVIQGDVEYRGLSTDAKPENAINGAAFLEMDTGKIYFYNADGEAWIEWGA